MSDIIKIYYEDQETGPAQLLGPKLARVIDDPVLREDLCRDAIVQLDRDPRKGGAFPRIVKVLYSPYACRTFLHFPEDDAFTVFASVMALLRSRAAVLVPPTDGRPGIMAVEHMKGLDPELFATALGIEQEDDEADEDEDDSDEPEDGPDESAGGQDGQPDSGPPPEASPAAKPARRLSSR